MTQLWQPGTQYNYGDEVVYNGEKYKIIQPHRSQGDWTPNIVPALWGKMQGGGGQHCNPPPQQCNPQKPTQHQPAPQQPQAPPAYTPPANQNQNKPTDNKHEQQQGKPSKPGKSSGNDSDSSDDEDTISWRKKLAMAAGGTAIAGAILAGALAAYKHYKKKNQEEWLAHAQHHTQCVRNGKAKSPVNWILCDGQNIPSNAISGGNESDNTPLYIARAYHKGSTCPGKASKKIATGCCIGYGNSEIGVTQYEILVGNQNSVKWVSCSGKVDLKRLNARPVEGGFDSDGGVLYIVRGKLQNATHPGKIHENWNKACIPYGGKETEVDSYEVLCYA